MTCLSYLQIIFLKWYNLLNHIFWNEVLWCLWWLKFYTHTRKVNVSKYVCCTLFNFSTGLTFFKIKWVALAPSGFPVPFHIALIFLNLLTNVSESEQEIKSGVGEGGIEYKKSQILRFGCLVVNLHAPRYNASPTFPSLPHNMLTDENLLFPAGAMCPRDHPLPM